MSSCRWDSCSSHAFINIIDMSRSTLKLAAIRPTDEAERHAHHRQVGTARMLSHA
jgi:hypothetical protein